MSVDLTRAVALLCALLLLRALGGRMLGALQQVFRLSFDAAGQGGGREIEALRVAAGLGLAAAAPLLLALLLGAAIAGFLQVGPLFAARAWSPRPSRIDPVAGFRRLFSEAAAFELLKVCAKLLAVTAIAFYTLRDGARGLSALVRRDAGASLELVSGLIFDMSIRIAAALALFAAIDFFYQRYQFRRRLRMTRRQWEQEQREVEGDPLIRGRQRVERQRLLQGAGPERGGR